MALLQRLGLFMAGSVPLFTGDQVSCCFFVTKLSSYLSCRSCGSCDAESCDSVTDAILDGLTEWEGVTMDTSGIDHYNSYQLLQIILHLSSLLLEVCINEYSKHRIYYY